jgi:hypothetical protein
LSVATSVPSKNRKKKRVLLVLKPSYLACIDQIAKDTGLSRMSLVRMWVVKALTEQGWPVDKIETKWGELDLQEEDDEEEKEEPDEPYKL